MEPLSVLPAWLTRDQNRNRLPRQLFSLEEHSTSQLPHDWWVLTLRREELGLTFPGQERRQTERDKNKRRDKRGM